VNELGRDGGFRNRGSVARRAWQVSLLCTSTFAPATPEREQRETHEPRRPPTRSYTSPFLVHHDASSKEVRGLEFAAIAIVNFFSEWTRVRNDRRRKICTRRRTDPVARAKTDVTRRVDLFLFATPASLLRLPGEHSRAKEIVAVMQHRAKGPLHAICVAISCAGCGGEPARDAPIATGPESAGTVEEAAAPFTVLDQATRQARLSQMLEAFVPIAEERGFSRPLRPVFPPRKRRPLRVRVARVITRQLLFPLTRRAASELK
jgi:hypothetical protein